MIADRSRAGAFKAVAGTANHADIVGFMAATSAIWAESRAAGRDWLEWEQWQAWGKAAIRSGLVRREHLTGESDDPPARFTGWPTDAAFWHVAIVRTWRRVQEARALSRSDVSYTARQFHRDEQLALKREEDRHAQRDRDQAADRAAELARNSSRGNRKHSGAAGDL